MNNTRKRKAELLIDIEQLHRRISVLESSQAINHRLLASQTERREAALKAENQNLIARLHEVKRMEELLQASEKNFRNLADTAPALIWVCNVEEARFLYLNAYFVEATGYSQEECLQMPIWDLLHSDFRHLVMERALSRFHGSQVPSRYEIKIITKDGCEKWLDMNSSNVIFNDQGSIMSVGIDITERKEAEEELDTAHRQLQESHQQLAELNTRLQANYAQMESMNDELLQSQVELMLLNAKLREKEERLEMSLWAASEAMWDLNAVTGAYIMDDLGIGMLGYDPAKYDVSLYFIRDLIHPDDREQALADYYDHIEGRTQDYQTEYRLLLPDGNYKWLWVKGRAIDRDENGRATRLVGLFRDINERKEMEDQIRFLSYHDSLTGIYNRAYLDEAMCRLNHRSEMPLAIVMGDVNGLKLVNDAFGHNAGDQYLLDIASFIKQACRPDDILARWGGDEFVILMPRTDLDAAYQVCEQIRQLCREADTSPIQPSIALGAQVKTEVATDMYAVLGEAEDVMYRNKLLETASIRNSIMSSLGATLHERTFETKEHTERMGLLSARFGKKLGLPAYDIDKLTMFAALHDIGKMGIPDDILSKPGPLTDDEWNIIKKHPEIGYRIIQAAHELSAVSEEILSHHERWDGKGYPKGLAGENIPYLARILSIVDSYDVMTNERPYKKALGYDEAIAELRRCSGTQFEPVLVDKFIEMLEEDCECERLVKVGGV